MTESIINDSLGTFPGGLSPSEREAVHRYLAERLLMPDATSLLGAPRLDDDPETQRLYERLASDDRVAKTSKDMLDLLEELISLHRSISDTPDG